MQYHANHAKARVMVNLNSWGFSENDTLYMDWMVNSAELRDEFRQKVLNYSAIIIMMEKRTCRPILTNLCMWILSVLGCTRRKRCIR